MAEHRPAPDPPFPSAHPILPALPHRVAHPAPTPPHFTSPHIPTPPPGLPQVAGLQGGAAPWVAIGKHLCGAATDFTLRSCARELQRRRRSGEQVPAGGGVRGLAVATCCHHRCCWQHFVAQEEMLQLGFSPQEFEVIAWMTGECRAAAGKCYTHM